MVSSHSQEQIKQNIMCAQDCELQYSFTSVNVFAPHLFPFHSNTVSPIAFIPISEWLVLKCLLSVVEPLNKTFTSLITLIIWHDEGNNENLFSFTLTWLKFSEQHQAYTLPSMFSAIWTSCNSNLCLVQPA